jgi:hypothetical protein
MTHTHGTLWSQTPNLKSCSCTVLVASYTDPWCVLMYWQLIPRQCRWYCGKGTPLIVKRGVTSQSQNSTTKIVETYGNPDCMRRRPPDCLRTCRTQICTKASRGSPQSKPHSKVKPLSISSFGAQSLHLAII